MWRGLHGATLATVAEIEVARQVPVRSEPTATTPAPPRRSRAERGWAVGRPVRHGARMRPITSVLVALALVVACGASAPERPVPDQALRRTTAEGDVVGFVGRYGSATWL